MPHDSLYWLQLQAVSPFVLEATEDVVGLLWSLSDFQSLLLMQVIVPLFSGGDLWDRLLKRSELEEDSQKTILKEKKRKDARST